MQNKKTAIIIVVFAVVAFVLVAFFALYKPMKEKAVETESAEVTGELPELVCNYKNDNAAYGDAFERKEVNQCECIENEELKNTCKGALIDLMFYDRALEQLDVVLCEKIFSETQKESCIKVVKDSVAQFEEMDPQYLADKYSMSHNEEAIDLLQTLIAENKDNIDNYVSLALAYAEKGLSEQEQGRDQMPYVDKALAVVEDAKKVSPEDSEVYRVEGYINEIKPDLDAAMLAYNTAIDISNENIYAHAGKGHVSRMLGMLDEAASEFSQAADLDVDNTQGYIYTNLCNLQYSRLEYEEAIRNCKITIGIENVDPIFQSEAYQILSSIFVDAGDYVQAKNYLLQAKSITPEDANLYITLSDLNLYEKDYVASEKNAREAIELSPNKSAAHLALAKALYMQEKYNDAIVIAEKGVTFVINDVSLLGPSKPELEGALYYAIANNYRQLENVQKQEEYEQKGDAAYERVGNQSTITE